MNGYGLYLSNPDILLSANIAQSEWSTWVFRPVATVRWVFCFFLVPWDEPGRFVTLFLRVGIPGITGDYINAVDKVDLVASGEDKNSEEDTVKSMDKENMINRDGTVDLVTPGEENNSKEDKSRNWMGKWAEGKFTLADNEELWVTDSEKIPQEDNYTISNEFKKEFNCSGMNPENAPPGCCMTLILNNENVPRGWRQAITIPEWEKVMEKEINELESNQAWEVVPRPKNLNVSPGVWNFRIVNRVSRVKTRLDPGGPTAGAVGG